MLARFQGRPHFFHHNDHRLRQITNEQNKNKNRISLETTYMLKKDRRRWRMGNWNSKDINHMQTRIYIQDNPNSFVTCLHR